MVAYPGSFLDRGAPKLPNSRWMKPELDPESGSWLFDGSRNNPDDDGER